jgi:hypothetical protein
VHAVNHSIFLKFFAGFGLLASKKEHLYIASMCHQYIVMERLFFRQLGGRSHENHERSENSVYLDKCQVFVHALE